MMTFPGAFHAGWSTGFNIAEANNVCGVTWLDHIDEGYKICISSKEKVPVFPKEWILIENINNFEIVDLPQSTWKKLWKLFVQCLIEEKELRESLIVGSHRPLEN